MIFLVLIFSLSFFSLAFPYGFPLFFPLACLAFTVSFFKRKIIFPIETNFVLLLICFTFYILGILYTGHVYLNNKKDILNFFGIFLIISVSYSEIREIKKFYRFRDITQILISNLFFSVAVISFYKFFMLLKGSRISYFEIAGEPYPWGTSLVADYNFFSFGMLIGTISALFCFRRTLSIIGKIWYLTGFFIMAGSGILSGSRRFWVVGSATLMVSFFIFLYKIIKNFIHMLEKRSLSKMFFKEKTANIVVLLFFLCILFYYGSNIQIINSNVIENLYLRFESLQDSKESFSSRTGRWYFALEILNNSNFIEIIFGQGFDYLSKYSIEFSGHGGEDYPHNPLISAVLYSGFIGCSALIILIIVSFIKYYNNISKDLCFLFIFVCSLFFVFTSGNSLFSIKFFPLLLVMPSIIERSMSRQNLSCRSMMELSSKGDGKLSGGNGSIR